VLAALPFLPGVGARDFWAPGEPISAEVIRVMYELMIMPAYAHSEEIPVAKSAAQSFRLRSASNKRAGEMIRLWVLTCAVSLFSALGDTSVIHAQSLSAGSQVKTARDFIDAASALRQNN